MSADWSKQIGFTLIELLLAVGLGILMTGLMLQIYSSNRAISHSQQGVVQIQQNGRFADYFRLSRVLCG